MARRKKKTVNDQRKARGMGCVSVWLPAPIKKWIEKEAKEQGMSAAAFVRGLVLRARHLEKMKNPKAPRRRN